MPASDVELVSAVLGGATERFSELVQRHDRRVRALVRERAGSAFHQEELVHQTFYLAFRNLGQLGDPAAFEAWLLRIAARCCADHLRAKGQRREEALRGSETSRSAGETWIWEEVALLPRAFREVLVLRYRLGCSYREIGARLALPESTIRGRIYEARRALRARLEPGGWNA